MTVLRRPNGPGGRSNHAPHNAPHHHQDPDPSPSSPHAAPAAPPVVAAQAAPQPRDQSFSDFLGPTVAFALAGGFYHFDYHSVTPGSLLLEAQTQPGQTGIQWFGNRVLNTFLVEGTVGATLGPAQFRLNNTDAAPARVTISGPM